MTLDLCDCGAVAAGGGDEQLDDVLGRLPADGSAIAVFQHDQLVGLLDPAHIDQLLAMRGMRPGGLA